MTVCTTTQLTACRPHTSNTKIFRTDSTLCPYFLPIRFSNKYGGGLIIGASVSEPHTSESNCLFFTYICVYISVVHCSVNVRFKKIRTPYRVHARTDGILKRIRAHGQVINATWTVAFITCSEFYFRVLLQSFTSEFVVTCFKHEYPEHF